MHFYPPIEVKNDRIKSIRNGHPWIYSRGIKKVPKNITNGAICTVIDEKNQFLAIGLYNEHSSIRIRIISWKDEKINKSFFKQRISQLKTFKEKLLPTNTDSYRVVFGESDLLPGLIVDKYHHVFVMQIHTLGMDQFREGIVEAIKGIFQPSAIYERSDLGIRRKEGLKTQPVGLLFGEDKEEVLIKENNLNFWVNFQKGQKTGFFLDQRENRNLTAQFCQNKKVLNCFSYSGGFSIYALHGGAKSVTSVDISKPALEYAKRNFEANRMNVKKNQFLAEDVFDILKNLKKGDYDLIILDPPSFAKKREQVKNAIKAYTTINSKALEKLPLGGLLISSSCTTHIDELTFIKILHQSSVNARCFIRLVANTSQPFDHAYNLSFPEGRYLKFFILEKFYEL